MIFFFVKNLNNLFNRLYRNEIPYCISLVISLSTFFLIKKWSKKSRLQKNAPDIAALIGIFDKNCLSRLRKNKLYQKNKNQQ